MSRKVYDACRLSNVERDYTDKEYTPVALVKDLLAMLNFDDNDTVIDAGSGNNGVWLDNIPVEGKIGLELSEGNNFYDFRGEVDWVVGNPPFREFIGFIFKSAEICRNGFAFLTNHNRINQITPRRLERLKDLGFYLNRIRVVSCRKWFGRYYFLVFTRDKSSLFDWSLVNY